MPIRLLQHAIGHARYYYHLGFAKWHEKKSKRWKQKREREGSQKKTIDQLYKEGYHMDRSGRMLNYAADQLDKIATAEKKWGFSAKRIQETHDLAKSYRKLAHEKMERAGTHRRIVEKFGK